jgi:hypothetical protein
MPPGAKPSTTCWSTDWASARVRSPPSLGSRHVVTGAIAPPTPCGARERRARASASLPRPAVTALSRAQRASSCPGVPRAQRAGSPGRRLGAGRRRRPARAAPYGGRPPTPAPRHGGPALPPRPPRFPGNGGPGVSWKEPGHAPHWHGRQGVPPGGPWARRGPRPPQPSEEPGASGQPCCGGSPVRGRPRGPESRGGGAQGAGGRDSAAGSQAAHSGLGRRPAKRGSSWERFLKAWTGGRGGGLVPSRPQSHNRARSWRWGPSPSGPLSSPASKAGRERDHLIAGPTISRSLKVHGRVLVSSIIVFNSLAGAPPAGSRVPLSW